MKTIRISATDARNNFFNLLNQVLYEDVRVVIEKAGANKEAVLLPKESKEKEYAKRMKVLKETYGILKDVPLSHLTDDRIRGKRARKYLEKIRKAW